MGKAWREQEEDARLGKAVTHPDRNSHHGKLWKRKQLLTHIPSQAVGTPFLAHGYLALGLV